MSKETLLAKIVRWEKEITDMEKWLDWGYIVGEVRKGEPNE